MNVATQTECHDCWPGCQNKRFQIKKYSNIDVLETIGKGFGLFAKEDIPSKQFVYEYFGELVSHKELIKRMHENIQERHLYAMQLSTKAFLDSRKKGSIGRFINHSCEPNCCIEIWNVLGKYHAGIFTTAYVAKDTELTFDYQVTYYLTVYKLCR